MFKPLNGVLCCKVFKMFKVKKNLPIKNRGQSFATVAIAALLLASLIGGVGPITMAFAAGATTAVPHYFGPYPNYATSQLPTVTNVSNVISVTGGIRKFIDSLPGLGNNSANNLGQYIPVAVADNTTYPGCDYYEIALIQYKEKMHTDLNATLLRGYVQLETSFNFAVSRHVALNNTDGTPLLRANGSRAIAVDNPQYLGPLIVAQRDRPVRVKFSNLLPTGSKGDLFLPVDTTIMGAGDGPRQIGTDGFGNPIFEQYTQNRATLHLHGGNTPWISDGTAHQWTTPGGESTSYPTGVSVRYVPDMWFVNGNVVANTVGNTTQPVAGASNNPGDGSLTFYYTNQQSGRLLFYHDHAYGITRLNVYAGEAAPYLITDQVEQALISAGIIPSAEIPLAIQDKTFVPDNTTAISNMWGNFSSQLAFQDPTWNTSAWGGPGSLWYPHVYMTNQNPYDPSGTNPFGRWDYSAWFWPPYQPVNGPVANPYYNASDPNNPMNPPTIPGTPNISDVMEAFMDTPVINGAAYPYLTVQPQAYRFRILNAADDRFWDLQWYIADNTTKTLDGRNSTEVKMVPAAYNATYPASWPTDGRAGGVPDPANMGPSFIQIGTESGFLPSPVVIPNQPVNWNRDFRTFDFGNVNQHALLLGTAERADVIVDFSQYAGKTLILYNDAPAAFPNLDPRVDYYTGKPDLTDSGGSPTTIAGYGPNTRTIMQVRVANVTAAAPFNLTTLNSAFASNATSQGVFAKDQNTIIVPQAAYSSAYNTTFNDVIGRIFDTNMTFTPIGSLTNVTLQFQPKSMHDEMNGALEPMYGRMSAQLGVEIPRSSPSTQTTILYNYNDPATELISPSINGTLIGSLNDGTQIWKITHNGVDTHTLHWHSFDVQLINRVAWDNTIHMPDPNELGWKDTLRINPLTDTYIALRPMTPIVPFDLPNSIRPIDPTTPLGTQLNMYAQLMDPTGESITLQNHVVNFGYEFTWHCHILGHEENDMMRPVSIAQAPRAPTNLTATITNPGVSLNWKDNSLGETNFTIQRAIDANFANGLTTFIVGANITTYLDLTGMPNQTYCYRVIATNIVGDTFVYAAPVVGFPTITANSAPSNIAISQVQSDAMYLVIRDVSNRINYRFYNLTTSTWGSWNLLPSGSTSESPAAAIINNELHIVVKGSTNNALYDSFVSLNNGTFSGWALLSGSTPSAPTLTGNSTHLYLAVRGMDNEIYYRSYSVVTRVWSNWASIETGTTSTTPAAALVNNQLFIDVKGSTNNAIYSGYISLNNGTFSGWALLSGSTPSAPTLTGNSTHLYLAVRGMDNAIYYRNYNIATRIWSSWAIQSTATSTTPAAALFNNKLYLAIKNSVDNTIFSGNVNLNNGTSTMALIDGTTLSAPTLTR
jgi:FtsP/CotA-like multicopper oxidase with cupredoxin domain